MVSFSSFYEKYRGSLRSYVVRNVLNSQLVDDVEQQTWISISKRWEEYDPALPFLPWAKGFFLNARRKIALEDSKQVKVRSEYRNYLQRAKGPYVANTDPTWLLKHQYLHDLYTEYYVNRNSLKVFAKKRQIDYNKVKRMHVRLKRILKERFGQDK